MGQCDRWFVIYESTVPQIGWYWIAISFYSAKITHLINNNDNNRHTFNGLRLEYFAMLPAPETRKKCTMCPDGVDLYVKVNKDSLHHSFCMIT